jgi:uncharacterized lipoprotein YddW (UPF0748 family)
MKRPSTSFAFILLLLVLPVLLAAQTPPKREFRAAWVATVVNLDWPSGNRLTPDQQRAELVSTLDNLQANGISAIMFQVRPECDAFYQSPYEPWSFWLTGAQGSPPSPFYDPLEFAVGEAHKRGMEIHAWFNPYRAVRSTTGYPQDPTHVSRTHPDWILTFLNSGTDSLRMLNPGLPMVREFVSKIVSDVVRRYDVDGVHFDDYFYPYSGITTEDAATFAAYPRGFTNIGNWRRDNVNLLITMVHDSIQGIKQFVKFGISPFGIWKSGVPPGISGLDAYSEIYCDAISWLRLHIIDYLTPQLYWKITGGQDYSKLMPWWADSASYYGRHFYPGMAPYRIPSYTASELPNQLRLNRANPKVGGEVYFRANNGINDNLKGFADSLRTDFYKYPALHPVMAWKDVVPPYPPRGIRFAPVPGTAHYVIQWDLPLTAPDGDSASRYAVYRFDHYPAKAEFDDPSNMLEVVASRTISPAPPSSPGGAVYFAVTALDRNYNESDTSNVLRVAVPQVPILASPTNGATGLPESVKVVWNTSPMAASYHLQVSTDPTFVSGILLDQSTIADTFKVIGNLVGQAAQYWRVNASNPAGTSSFSNPFSFTPGFPAVSALLFPPNVQIDVPVSTNLVWGTATAATNYRLQLSTAADFSLLVVDSTGMADTSFAPPTLQSYKNYYWRVKAINTLGASAWSSAFRFRTIQVVSVEEGQGLPKEYALSQNYPNPFNPVTTIQFEVPHAGRVVIKVYDVLGKEKITLVDREMQEGQYTVQWDASSAASGVYFYQMMAGNFVATKRMVVLK